MPPPPPLDAFLTILAIHTTFNHLGMNPSDIFSFWGHCKFVNANSKAKSKLQRWNLHNASNLKMQRRNLVLDSYKFQTFTQSRFIIQLSRWKKNEWKLFNIPLESPPNSSKLEDEL
jgi:hypothetical protein